jgi:holo-[acyl-carrier protein] synthase
MRIGIDILLISRFARITESPRYCRVLFTEKELRRAAGLRESRRHEHLAGRFCAKEAVAKMLGRGFGQGLVWRDIEILADPWGAPSSWLRAAKTSLSAIAVTRAPRHAPRHEFSRTGDGRSAKPST